MYQSLSEEIQRKWGELKHRDMEDRDPYLDALFGGNTGEIKAARKGTVNLPHNANGLVQVSSLTGTPQRTNRILDLPLPFNEDHKY